MELDNLMGNLLNHIEGSDVKDRNYSIYPKFVEVLRRIKKGWWVVILIILTCLFLAWLLYIPLSQVHFTKTKMGVMFNKEREANSRGNVSYEIVSGITGWTTTTNKYDEMAILTSHTIVGNMLQETGYLDSAYYQHVQEVGHVLTPADSVKFVNAYVESFLKRVEATNSQTSIKSNINTSLITLSMGGSVDECGPLLTGLVKSYNRYTREYNYKLYDNTLRFLDRCIDSLRHDLDKIDEYDQMFREEHKIVDYDQQTDEYLSVDREMEGDLRNINLQMQLLSIIRNYMVEMGHDYKVVPANTGIEDAQINRIVIQFNDLVMRRSNFLTSMGEDAMRVQTITNQIEDQREAIIISIDKLTQSFNIRKAKYEKDLEESGERLQKMPRKRITLDQIGRERGIKTPLYRLLQEKYTETLIAKSAEQDQARIITYPFAEDTKLFNGPQKLYLLGLIIGIILSILYLWYMKLPPHKMTLEEALQKCNLPCWGMLPEGEDAALLKKAMEALLTRIRMSGAKTMAVTCSYGYEENELLAEQLLKIFEQQGEKCQLVRWTPDNQQQFIQKIDQHNNEDSYLILDCGSYHTNPEMPLISSKVDITLWNIVLQLSTLKSVDFINYSLKEGLVKKGALVLTEARIDKSNQVSFGNFDYTPLTGLAGIIEGIKD